MGKRMRPHTLTTPKPLLKVAGKPIVQWLIEDIANVCDEKIDEIGFVIGDFGSEVEENLKKLLPALEPLGESSIKRKPLELATLYYALEKCSEAK